VVEHIYEYVDGEVTPEALAAVREHLLSCPPCLEQYDVQVALKALVRRCCQDRAPEELRVRILARITETRTTGLAQTRISEVRLVGE
jgi:mycothiol system anti-sigma-R factor